MHINTKQQSSNAIVNISEAPPRKQSGGHFVPFVSHKQILSSSMTSWLYVVSVMWPAVIGVGCGRGNPAVMWRVRSAYDRRHIWEPDVNLSKRTLAKCDHVGKHWRQNQQSGAQITSFCRKLTPNVRGPSYLDLTRSISWLLMPWLLTSPGHHQPWYWLCRICGDMTQNVNICLRSLWKIKHVKGQ